MLIASDLARSVQTAAILGARWGVVPRHDARLREIDIGAWTGLTREQIVERDAERLARFEAEQLEARPGGGETRLEIRARVRAAAAELEAAHRGRRVALVTHLGVIRALVPGAETANAGWLRLAARRARGRRARSAHERPDALASGRLARGPTRAGVWPLAAALRARDRGARDGPLRVPRRWRRSRCWLAVLAARPDLGPDSPRQWIGAGLASALAGARAARSRAAGWRRSLRSAWPRSCSRGACARRCASIRRRPGCRRRRSGPRSPSRSRPTSCSRSRGRRRAARSRGPIARAWRPTCARRRIAIASTRWNEHPERAYLAPPPLEKLQLTSVVLRGAGSAEHLRFASEFEPVDPGGARSLPRAAREPHGARPLVAQPRAAAARR